MSGDANGSTAPSRPDTAWLCVPAPGGTAECPLTSEQTLLGRTSPAHIVLPLPQVSRRHALVRREGGGHLILDLHSRNGTFVNGEQVGSAPRRLAHGDVIVLGGAVELRYLDPAQTQAGPGIGRLRGLWLDERDRSAWVDGVPVSPPLSPAQYALLALLYESEGAVVTRRQIVAAVWPECDPAGVSDEAVGGLIKRLRSRLRQAQPGHDYIEVLRGHGLRLANLPDL